MQQLIHGKLVEYFFKVRYIGTAVLIDTYVPDLICPEIDVACRKQSFPVKCKLFSWLHHTLCNYFLPSILGNYISSVSNNILEVLPIYTNDFTNGDVFQPKEINHSPRPPRQRTNVIIVIIIIVATSFDASSSFYKQHKKMWPWEDVWINTREKAGMWWNKTNVNIWSLEIEAAGLASSIRNVCLLT